MRDGDSRRHHGRAAEAIVDRYGDCSVEPFVRRVPLILVGIAMAGCETGVSDLECPDEGCNAPLATSLVISTEALDFGVVAPACSSERRFTVSNPTDRPLTFSARQAGPLPPTMEIAPAGPIVLAPGEVRTVTVTFWSAFIDTFAIAVQLCDDGCEQTIEIDVEFPDQLLSCEDVDFGDVAVGTCVDRSFSCENIVGEPLDVSILEASNGSMSIAPAYIRAPPGVTYEGTITFCPTRTADVRWSVDAFMIADCEQRGLTDPAPYPLLVARGRGI